jgi:hypothetical protein
MWQDLILLAILGSRWAWGCSQLCRWHWLSWNPMHAAFVSDECGRDKHKHHDQNDALLVFREFENPEKAFHLTAA